MDPVECVFCNGEAKGDTPSVTINPATHEVGGYPLCVMHAMSEVTDIILHPETFVHGDGDDADTEKVPFYTEIRML